MRIESQQDFLKWEKSSRDCLDIKLTYIDMAGDLPAGVMLSQLIYWYLPSKNTDRDKLRVKKDGEYWIVKGYNDWWDECRLSIDQAKRALNILREKKIIITSVFKFDGTPKNHIRINWPVFVAEVNKLVDAQAIGDDLENEHSVHRTFKSRKSDILIDNQLGEKPPVGFVESPLERKDTIGLEEKPPVNQGDKPNEDVDNPSFYRREKHNSIDEGLSPLSITKTTTKITTESVESEERQAASPPSPAPFSEFSREKVENHFLYFATTLGNDAMRIKAATDFFNAFNIRIALADDNMASKYKMQWVHFANEHISKNSSVEAVAAAVTQRRQAKLGNAKN